MAASLFGVVEHWARSAGGAVAAIDAINGAGALAQGPPASLTYADLHEAAERLAAHLAPLITSVRGLRDASPSEAAVATWMRRGTGWYCVFMAAARLKAPLVALSTDLTDSETQRCRNEEILDAHRPLVLVYDDSSQHDSIASGSPAAAAMAAMRSISLEKLWAQAWAVDQRPVPDIGSAGDVLCYNYTGGTTKASRCARVTHRMALHEVAAYPKVISLTQEDRVLQQHSLYWAASAFGEVDIALAFGCSLVFCEAFDVDGVAAAIRQSSATCAGLVPSMLAALEPADLPTLRAVFTWGEALQARVAREWAGKVQLLDLLISTECWLSLYADWTAEVKRGPGTARPAFVPLPEAQIRLKAVSDAGPSDRHVGELLVSGPMVSPGYTDEALEAEAFETDAEGVRWYCTKDCLQRLPCGGFAFAGRADDLVKVGGAWVDTREVEAKLLGVEDVAEACISGRRAFVVLKSLGPGVMHSLRTLLPPDFVLFIAPAPLPRRVGTGKVDRRRLAEMVDVGATDASVSACQDKEAKLCLSEMNSLFAWYRPLYALGAVALLQAGRRVGGYLHGPALARHLPRLLLPLGFQFVGELAWRFLCLSYMVLGTYYCSRLERACQNLPIGVHSLALALSVVAPGPSWGLALASPGMLFAARNGRLLSWPLVCSLGFPIWARECGQWMSSYSYRGMVSWYLWKAAQPIYNLGNCGVRRGVGAITKARRRLERSLGRLRKCDWCKEETPLSRGHSDTAVDTQWYCSKCWEVYDKYVECPRCKKYAKKELFTSMDGAAVCRDCFRSHKAAAVSNGQASTAPQRSLNSADDTRGRKRPMVTIEPIRNNLARCYLDLSSSSTRQEASASDRGAAALEADDGAQCDDKCKGRDWRLVERATGLTFNSLSDSLIAIDSLRRTKLTSVLRREQGKRLPREAIQRSSTLGDLLGELERLPDNPQAPANGEKALREGCAVWGIMWYSRCLWTLRRSRALPEAVLREALSQLIERHEALRAELRDPYRLFGAVQQAFTVFELWRRHGHDFVGQLSTVKTVQRMLGPKASKAVRSMGQSCGSALNRAMRWSFHRSWPRSGASSSASTSSVLKMMRHSATEEEAAQELYKCPRAFNPPFEVFVAGWGGPEEERRQEALAPTKVAALKEATAMEAAAKEEEAAARTAREVPVAGEAPAGRLPVATRESLADREMHATAAKGPAVTTEEVPTPDALSTEQKVTDAATRVQPGSKEGAFLRVIVTHMLCDGYSLVPLLSDLAQLVARLEATDGEDAPLPHVPSSLSVMESRIRETVNGDLAADGGPAGITREPIGSSAWRWAPPAYTVYAYLPSAAVATVRTAARHLSVPDDIAMLTGIGTALALFQGRRTEVIAMIVPQRDGSAENEMIGLFADVRHMPVATAGLSFAGVALRLHHTVEQRLWHAPGLATQMDFPLVNFQWTDFTEQHGFSQNMYLGETAEAARHPLKIAVEQPDIETWRIRVSVDREVYSEARCHDLVRLLDDCLRALHERPLDLVWPEDAKESSE